MPVDPRIPLGIEPVNFANKPFEGLRDVLAMQEAQQRMQASAQKLRAEQDAQRETMAVRQILQETGGDWNAALPRIRQVAPGASIEIEKQLGDMRAKAADAMVKQFELEEKQEADTLAMLQFVRGNPSLYAELLPTFQKRVPKLPQQMWPAPDAPDLETQLDRLSQINISVIDQTKANQENVRLMLKGDLKGVERALGTADDPQDWNAALDSADFLLQLPRGTTRKQYGEYSPEKVVAFQKGETGGAFTLSPGSRRFDAQGKEIASVPANEGGSAGFTLSPGQVRYGPDGKPIASRPAAAGGGGQSRAELVDAVMANPGIYANLTPTVKTAISAELAKRGFTFENAGKPSTAAQKRVLNFFNRAKQADDELERVESEIAKMGLGGQVRMQMPNVLQSETGQAYTQAQRAFTEARLRKDSGAAIPEAEFANDRRTYFVQPGDTPATLAQKRRARAAILSSLAFESGPALREDYGEQSDELVGTYRTRASGQDAAPPQQPQRSSGAPRNVAGLLDSKGPGRYTLSDRSVWEKRPDGSVVRIR